MRYNKTVKSVVKVNMNMKTCKLTEICMKKEDKNIKSSIGVRKRIFLDCQCILREIIFHFSSNNDFIKYKKLKVNISHIYYFIYGN